MIRLTWNIITFSISLIPQPCHVLTHYSNQFYANINCFNVYLSIYFAKLFKNVDETSFLKSICILYAVGVKVKKINIYIFFFLLTRLKLLPWFFCLISVMQDYISKPLLIITCNLTNQINHVSNFFIFFCFSTVVIDMNVKDYKCKS